MKVGFCMLLWSTHVTEQHLPLLAGIKAAGYDGVEVPIFEGRPSTTPGSGQARRRGAGGDRASG